MRRLIFIAAITLVLFAAWARAQNDARGLPRIALSSSLQSVLPDSSDEDARVLPRFDRQEYRRTLDTLFSHSVPPKPSDQIVLRLSYEPTGEPERAILLRSSFQGEAVIEEVIAEASVRKAMKDTRQNGKPYSLEDIEKLVAVRRRSFDLHKDEAAALTMKLLNSWAESVLVLSEEFAKLHEKGVGKIYLDGARYRISLRLSGSQMALEFSRTEMPVEPGDDALPVMEVIAEFFENVRAR